MDRQLELDAASSGWKRLSLRRWYGFLRMQGRAARAAVDVAIRIRPLAGQTRIDIRSASRFGRHDLGTNAARIQSLADELQDADS